MQLGAGLIGLNVAAVLLLAAAGSAKLRRPARTRSALTAARLPGAGLISASVVNRGAGVVELLAALVAFAVGGRVTALILLGVYGCLATVSARMVSVERGQDCGCFAKPTPVSHWHTAVNLSAALVGAIGLIWPTDSLLHSFGAQPVHSSAVVFGAAVLAYLGYLMMTALPDLLATVAAVEVVR